jgi:predicted nucleic acid-binding Zn ribbon protein
MNASGTPKRGRPVSVGSAAKNLMGRLDTNGGLERARAVAVWCEVAGPEVSSHAKGFAMRDAELVVYVDSPAWATELTAMSEHYRAALNTALGKEMVGSIRFTVSRAPRGAESDAPTRRAPQVTPATLSDDERAGIAEMAETIHSEAVRHAVIRAVEASLGWRKGLEGEAGDAE